MLARNVLCHLPRICTVTALPPSVSAISRYVVTSLRRPGESPMSAFGTKARCLCWACCYFREDVHFVIN